MAALSGSPDLLKSRGSEGIDNGGLVRFGMGDGRRDQLGRESFAAMIAFDEQAGERPDPLRRRVRRKSAEWAVCLTRRDGTPGHGLVAHIADEADRYPAVDSRLDLSPTAAAVLAFAFGWRSSPNHAPTTLWAATLLKKTCEISPTNSVDVPEMKLIHAGALTGLQVCDVVRWIRICRHPSP